MNKNIEQLRDLAEAFFDDENQFLQSTPTTTDDGEGVILHYDTPYHGASITRRFLQYANDKLSKDGVVAKIYSSEWSSGDNYILEIDKPYKAYLESDFTFTLPERFNGLKNTETVFMLTGDVYRLYKILSTEHHSNGSRQMMGYTVKALYIPANEEFEHDNYAIVTTSCIHPAAGADVSGVLYDCSDYAVDLKDKLSGDSLKENVYKNIYSNCN